MINKLITAIKETIPYLIIIGIIILIRLFIVTPVRVDGPSMDNTLKDGQLLILNKLDTSYNRFDIIVFKLSDDKLIKRIIGLPGDTIELKDNKLYINDEYIEETYLDKENLDKDNGNYAKTTIKEGYYFVMGDNRKDSFDSRYFGVIEKKQIIGTVNIRLFPFNKIGKINK